MEYVGFQTQIQAGLYFWGGKWQISPGPKVKFSKIHRSQFKKKIKKLPRNVLRVKIIVNKNFF